jgi:diguanylate cyclase (GGDEF)-like protein/PAS domain S-box-containing protein
MLFVAALAFSVWKVVDNVGIAARGLAHSQALLHLLDHTRVDTVQIEQATKDYRQTGDVAYLLERNRVIGQREQLLAQLREQISDNPVQVGRWIVLRKVIDQRLAISHEIERLRQMDGPAAASAYADKAPLRLTRTEVYRLLNEMDQEEYRLLSQQQAIFEHAQQLQLWLSSITGTALFLLLGGTYLLVRRQWRENNVSRRALAASEEGLLATLHSIGEAVVSVDAEGRITRFNRIAEHLTGWPATDAGGLPVAQVLTILDDVDGQPVDLFTCGAQQTGHGTHGPKSWHGCLVARDGKQCPVNYTSAPIVAFGGLLRGVVFVFRDATAELEARQTILTQNALLAEHVQDRTSRLLETEAHLNTIISAVPAMIAYVNADRRYMYVNEQYRQRFAPDLVDITGLTVREILGEERYAVACPLIDKVLAGQPQGYDWQPFQGIWQNIRYLPKRSEQGEILGYYVLGTDITERKSAEEHIQLLNSELSQRVHELEHVSRALRTLSASNRAMLRARDEQQLLESSCEAIVTAGGYDMAVIWYGNDEPQSLQPMAQCGFGGGLNVLEGLHLGSTDAIGGQSITPMAVRSGKLQLARDMQTDSKYESLRELLDGAASGLACPLVVEGGIIGALTIYDTQVDTFDDDEIRLLSEVSADLAFGIATLRAQTERELARASIHRMLRFDQLTGLPNMLKFEEALTLAIVHCNQEGQGLAVLQFNIERLGEINEVLGFAQGDLVLREFGARLASSIPPAAQVARVRGDEFAVLLPDAGVQESLALVVKAEREIAKAFEVAGLLLDVTAKVGVALFPQHGNTAHDLLRRMDKAVQQAKKRGLGHCVFDPGKGEVHSDRLTLARDLRHAITTGELRLYLQPKVRMANGRVCGAEALLRWQHPLRGLLAPGMFIDVAEQTGLIHPITEWVITATLAQLQAWQQQQLLLPIAVNLSMHNLQDGDLPAKIRCWLNERAVLPGLLELEITESSVMEDPEMALGVLHELHGEGIGLFIDDYGTGYSSLSYLHRLPVDYIKIDQSFVMSMATDNESAVIVQSTIELVHNLGRQAVAEGVESEADWFRLREWGCDYAQGYFIAPPMPADQFTSWVVAYRAPQ